MKDCYYSRKNRILRCSLLIVGVFSHIGLTAYGLFIIIIHGLEDKIIIPCGIIIIAAGILMIVEASLQYHLLNRKYMVDISGLCVQHTTSKKQFYSWEQISQVCLCDIHKGANEGANEQFKDTVIWCTVGSIKWGPPDAKRRWNNPHYGIRYFRSVVTIEFSEERLSEFERFYGGVIEDYRK